MKNKEKFLVFHTGDGRANYSEHGIFEVKYEVSKNKMECLEFTSLTEACKFYDSLFCEKVLWKIGYLKYDKITNKQLRILTCDVIESHSLIKKAPTK
jgi:hypothetical protein